MDNRTKPNLEVRARLIGRISERIRRRGLKQREAAELFGTTQPRISELVRGKVDEFTIDSLVNMLASAGLGARVEWGGFGPDLPDAGEPDPVTTAYAPGIDRTLLRANLRKTPTERVQALAALQRLADEARRSRARSRSA